jgi:hypothetical protein
MDSIVLPTTSPDAIAECEKIRGAIPHFMEELAEPATGEPNNSRRKKRSRQKRRKRKQMRESSNSIFKDLSRMNERLALAGEGPFVDLKDAIEWLSTKFICIPDFISGLKYEIYPTAKELRRYILKDRSRIYPISKAKRSGLKHLLINTGFI